METQRVWYGSRNWLRGDDEYGVYEFNGEQIGELTIGEDEVGNRGVTYRVYRTEEGTVIVHTHEWSRYHSEDHNAYVDKYGSLDEAALDGFANVLLTMRITDMRTYQVEDWRKQWKEKPR